MTPLFKKMNFKGQREILVLNAPPEFDEELIEMAKAAKVKAQVTATTKAEFVLVFVTELEQIEKACALIHPRLLPQAVWWFAYPKGTSKKYKCAFNRDNGWASLGVIGFEGVRMVAIDQDWSALRFKPLEQIKNFTRSAQMALSEEGQ